MTATNTNSVELNVEYTAIAQRLHQLRRAREDITAEEDELKRRVRKLLTAGQRGLVNGRPVIAVQPNRRFDVERGAALLPEALREQCLIRTWDTKRVRQLLAPALSETCMQDAGEPKVVVLDPVPHAVNTARMHAARTA